MFRHKKGSFLHPLNTKTSILTIVFGVASLVWMLVALKIAANHKLIIGVIMTIVLVIAVVTIIVKFVCEYNKIADGTKLQTETLIINWKKNTF
ncbi:MAG: hypothetical protein ACLT2Z_05335 [Eubacterium sp.]